MSARVVVTSGDPATGVVTIEQAPTEPCPPGCYSAGCSADHHRGLSLPATVEVAERLFLGHGADCEHRTVGSHRAWCFDCREWCYPEAPCPRCDLAVRDGYAALPAPEFYVLGTATLEAVLPGGDFGRSGQTCVEYESEGFKPWHHINGVLWLAGDIYDALTPGGLVAYLTDWKKAS